MPFKVLQSAVKVRANSMPVLAGRVVESADTPARRDDYLKIQGLRLVRDAHACMVSLSEAHKAVADNNASAAGQAILF